MAVITRWTPFTTTPIIGSTTYPEDIDTRNTEMASRMEEIDDMGQEMNGVADEVEANGNTVASNLVQSNSDKADAEAASAAAVAAAEAIEAYVIPEDATYAYSDIDAKDELQNAGTMTASGYVGGRIVKADMFTEGSTPNEITVTPKSVRFEGDKIYPITDTEIVFDKAPFASGSTDELLDDATNGVTTQSDHSVGDMIVTGNELVENGTFDTDTSSWDEDDSTLSVVSNKLRITTIATYGNARQVIDTVAGEDYILSSDISAGTGTGGMFAKTGDGVSNIKYVDDVDGFQSFTFTAVGSTTMVLFRVSDDIAGHYCDYDNISVTLKDKIYQCIEASTADDLLTDTTKFQVLTRVTRFDIVVITKTGYETYKGLDFFSDGTSNDEIASARNWSKIGNGIYHDGTKEVIIAGLVPRLNSGALSPIFNSQGCRKFSDEDFWYETEDTVLSIFDCYNNRSTSATTGRSDSKVENIVYYESNGGIVFKPTYSQQANEHDLLAENIDLDMAEHMASGTEQFLQTTTGTVATIEVEDGTLYKEFNYINIYDLTATTLKGRYLIESIDGDELTLTTTLSKSANDYLIGGLQSPHSLTQGDKIDTVAICDPQYLPSDWLTCLAGGNTIDVIMNTNSVNGGASLLPNGTTDDFLMPSKILSASTGGDLIYDNSAGTWGAGTTDITSNTDNIITSTNLPADDVSLSSYISQNNPLRFDDLTDYETIIESDYIFASNTNNVLTDIAATINAVTGGISVGTDDTEKLSITKVIAGVITHTAETLTEDALVSFALFNNTTTKEYAIGCYFATDGVIDKADGAYIMNTGVFK